jgi:hypothetical protein
MVIAECKHNNVTVEIESIFYSPAFKRNLACIRALPVNGKHIFPFASFTHGGWCADEYTRIEMSGLKNVRKE